MLFDGLEQSPKEEIIFLFFLKKKKNFIYSFKKQNQRGNINSLSGLTKNRLNNFLFLKNFFQKIASSYQEGNGLNEPFFPLQTKIRDRSFRWWGTRPSFYKRCSAWLYISFSVLFSRAVKNGKLFRSHNCPDWWSATGFCYLKKNKKNKSVRQPAA